MLTFYQLKALAEEYVAYYTPDNKDEEAHKELVRRAHRHFDWLNERFSLIKTSKIKKLHDDYMYLSKHHPKASERKIAKELAKGLEILFRP